MATYRKILLILLFAGVSLASVAHTSPLPVSSVPDPLEQTDDTMTIYVVVNGATKVKMENIPDSGYLEVYSILGVRVSSVNLKTISGEEHHINLPKGLYILKAGKVAVKVIVK
ncbi:T9SS type A sorting domain-containing protein [Dysgonomonas sp. 511]|uniref:T9SS type A sorting domain-containing protein n=1 Tax=Dysgonomonas sp. 511 TaxID=2302930 RepID=UPI0013CFF8B7|nr:T9SS type A sorting domain-containing protein [Dysgonomonas sp. 511]NDV78724.1 T9SS C-terminal target domain-containing protein [Dysgonomonas sp. 511]